MSFFGFDPSVPPHLRQQNPEQDSYDFQDTYDGLGDGGADDALNNETFGGAEPDNNFAFGNPGQARPAPLPAQNLSYAQAATHSTNDDDFMNDLWGAGNAPQSHNRQMAASQPVQPQVSQPVQGQPQERTVLSLDDIEAQLTAIDHRSQQPPLPPYMMGGMMPPGYGGYMKPMGQYMPPPGQFGYPMQQMQQMHQMQQMPQMPPQMPFIPMGQGMAMGHQMPAQVPQQQQPQQQPPQQQQPQAQAQTQGKDTNVGVGSTPAVSAPSVSAPAPVSGSTPAPSSASTSAPLSGPPSVSGLVPDQPKSADTSTVLAEPRDAKQFPLLGTKLTGKPAPRRLTFAEMTPEQQAKATKRHEKVARIMNYSGVMTPKDKDFVTRFQLSQIVTDDPYNEDFYAQVFKVIHPKPNANPQQQQADQNNSIAQAYLDQSGHRLGGRHKRADVALQRMQQQIQKAVTVAKERTKLTQYAKEGALGKISLSSGKKPRQQLEILSKAAQREKSQAEAGVALSAVQLARSFTKTDIMNIIESVINNIMAIESESRTNTAVDTTQLWESLHILDHPSTSGDEESSINPFIQALNYNKMLKILPRLFKFLSREQVLTISTLVMSNLENLLVIKNGSYTTYPDQAVPAGVLKLVDHYTLTFSKVLMNAVQEFKFNEIIGLLMILIEHNNVSFVSTTKIGLSVITTLLSRAELIKGEGQISATDLSEWLSCYDELFSNLESRIAAIFPPHPEDVDDGSSRENYVWQFLATLSLGGKLSHQRIIVDEVRDEIFGVMSRAKAIDNADLANLYKKQNLLNNLNMYLVVMGLVADESEIKELQ